MNTSGPPQEVFKKIEEIFSRRFKVNEPVSLTLPEQNLLPIPEVSSDPRSGDNVTEPTERVPQSIIEPTQRVDPILNNHDLLKSDLQNSSSPPHEIQTIVSHGDSPQIDQTREQDMDDIAISNQSSDFLSEDGVSKSSSSNVNSVKENTDSVEQFEKKSADVIDEDLAESLYS